MPPPKKKKQSELDCKTMYMYVQVTMWDPSRSKMKLGHTVLAAREGLGPNLESRKMILS